jgi:Tol biopolymer transport system component
MPHRVTTNSAENSVITASISPDGRYFAYADAQFITLRSLRSAETRSIPVEAGVRPIRVAWYPSGTRLLVSETVNEASTILVFSILTGKLTLPREDAASPSASPDGTRVLYADGSYRELWLMDANGENPRRILTAAAPDRVYPLFWSPDGMRVWFARVHWDKDVDIITLETRDLNGARGTVVLSDNRTSAFCLLPPGRLIYAVVEAASQKFTNLWEMPVDPAAGTPRGPVRKLTNWANFSISGLSATADGRRLAFTNGTWQANVYMADLRAGGTELTNTRRLTSTRATIGPDSGRPTTVPWSSNPIATAGRRSSGSASIRPCPNCSTRIPNRISFPSSAGSGSTSSPCRWERGWLRMKRTASAAYQWAEGHRARCFRAWALI